VDLGARLPPRSPRGPPRDPQPRGRREDHHPGRRDQIPESNFVRGRVVDVDTNEQVVETDDGTTVDYDYLLLGVGSTTAFFGIEGLEENAHQLKSLADAKAIHEDVRSAAAEATRSDPVEVIVGGAGLSGIQTAGEIAEYRDKHRAPVDIKLVEGLDEVFPGNDPQLQGALRQRLEDADIEILTGDFISKADEDAVYFGGGEETRSPRNSRTTC